jgi:hypothetical protein
MKWMNIKQKNSRTHKKWNSLFKSKMQNKIDFKTLPDKVQDYLNNLSALVSNVVPIEIKTWRFNTEALEPASKIPDLIAEVALWADKNNVYLYTLRIITENYDIEKFNKSFSNAKKLKKDNLAYTRFNNKKSQYLYVGRSSNLSQRLREHMGYGAKGTYALHLAYWANAFNLEIEFQCAKYKAGLASDVYQVLEDTLWQEMSPMFGRKGSK